MGEVSEKMSDGEAMVIENEARKRFGVYVADAKGKPCNTEGRFGTYDQVMGHCWRWDRRYLIEVGQEFFTFTEFVKKFAPIAQK